MERLQKYLSECGVASRRKCEEIILTKKVKVNGQIISELGYKINENNALFLSNLGELTITNSNYKMICINDFNIVDFDRTREKVNRALDIILPKPSRWEVE